MRYFRASEVWAMLGISKSTLYAWISAGDFPEGELLSQRTRRWEEETIQHWALSRKNPEFSERALRALRDRLRGAKEGAKTTKSDTEAFWAIVYADYLKSGLTILRYAATRAAEGNDPIYRTYRKGSKKPISYDRIVQRLHEMEKKQRP